MKTTHVKTFHKARLHMLSGLVCLGRHTVTGLLRTSGKIFTDWSADYRFYGRFDSQDLFDLVSAQAMGFLPRTDQPLVVSMDDSLLRKGGNHTHGVGWRRDPLGPPFHTNFVRGQRILQLSACLPARDGSARSVPIDFQHAVVPKKPRKDAPEAAHQAYREAVKASNINRVGAERIAHLRERIDSDRALHLCVDGRFTNRTIFKSLPPNTTLIGRIRKDAALHYPVDETDRAATGRHRPAPAGAGRRRVYGKAAPTPEELRQDSSVPWQPIEAYAAGKRHRFKVKQLGPLKWRKAGGEADLQIVVIAPLGYRLCKGGKILYRQPAYLICTDPNLDLQAVLQQYLWRWDIEVNFRDEKNAPRIGTSSGENRSCHPERAGLERGCLRDVVDGEHQNLRHRRPPRSTPRAQVAPPSPGRPRFDHEFDRSVAIRFMGQGASSPKFLPLSWTRHHLTRTQRNSIPHSLPPCLPPFLKASRAKLQGWVCNPSRRGKGSLRLEIAVSICHIQMTVR